MRIDLRDDTLTVVKTKADRCREWRQRNPGYNDKFKQAQKEWREANKEHLRETNLQRYWDNGYREEKSQANLEFKVTLIELRGGCCQRCGFDHPAALEFHHRDPATKSFGIAASAIRTRPKKYPWDLVLEEIEKCDLLCSNCHKVEHSLWEWEG